MISNVVEEVLYDFVPILDHAAHEVVVQPERTVTKSGTLFVNALHGMNLKPMRDMFVEKMIQEILKVSEKLASQENDLRVHLDQTFRTAIENHVRLAGDVLEFKLHSSFLSEDMPMDDTNFMVVLSENTALQVMSTLRLSNLWRPIVDICYERDENGNRIKSLKVPLSDPFVFSSLENSAPATVAPQEKKQKRNNAVVIAVCTIVGILLIAMIVFFACRAKKKPTVVTI